MRVWLRETAKRIAKSRWTASLTSQAHFRKKRKGQVNCIYKLKRIACLYLYTLLARSTIVHSMHKGVIKHIEHETGIEYSKLMMSLPLL